MTEKEPSLKIALIGLTYPFRGGISHYTTLLYKTLASKHDVTFFSLNRQYPDLLFPGKTQKDLSQQSFTVPNNACIDSINPITWIATFVKIRRLQPDFILFSWWNPFFAPAFGSISWLAKLISGIPSCFLCHNVIPHERSMIDVFLLRTTFAVTDTFIVHSEEDRENLIGIKPDADVHKNPHPTYGVFSENTDSNGADLRDDLGLRDKKVLLFFGYIREYKGLEYLLQAMEKLPTEDGFHLLVVGEFYEDQEKYSLSINRLKSSGQLTLVDHYVPNEEVSRYFEAADVVVVPYLTATQSGIIQIAYGFEKPVIATTVGGLPEVVADGQTGYLVAPSDADAIAMAVRKYYKDRDFVDFPGNIRAENKKYSWDAMLETIEAIGVKILIKRGR